MDWKVATEAEQAMLKRIVALLFALADLAELSCDRSPAVRGLVLWLLLTAEAVVQNLVANSPAHRPFRHAGNSPADAMRLARSLRELAGALRELSCRALACAIDTDDLPAKRIRASRMALANLASMVVRLPERTPYDTS